MPSGGEFIVTPEQQQNVDTFLQTYGFDPADSVKVGVMYQPNSTYTKVIRAMQDTSWDTKADAIFTKLPGKTIYLPVADCVGTVVYDPVAGMLGVLHLGRHSSVVGLIEVFAERVRRDTASDPAHWRVWMSPSIQRQSNRLRYFEPPHPAEWNGFVDKKSDDELHVDIPRHNTAHFIQLGVKLDNMYVSQIDTYTDERYFSHRASNELSQPHRQGRMIVAAQMTD